MACIDHFSVALARAVYTRMKYVLLDALNSCNEKRHVNVEAQEMGILESWTRRVAAVKDGP